MKFLVDVLELREQAFLKREDILDVARRRARTPFQRKTRALEEDGKTVRATEFWGREGANLAEHVLSRVMLGVLDEKWKDHLYDLDQVRNAITYRAWGQRDPLVEYKKEAYEMFVDLMADLRGVFTEQFLKVQVTAAPAAAPPPPPRPGGGGRPSAARSRAADLGAEDALVGAEPAPQRLAGMVGGAAARLGGALPSGWEKTGRNDPCPCGSGKKFKRCH